MSEPPYINVTVVCAVAQRRVIFPIAFNDKIGPEFRSIICSWQRG